jgi:CBS domain-containing protein
MDTVSPLRVRVGDLVSRPRLTCRPSCSLREVARLMMRADCGSVVVVGDNGHPHGIITDSDLRRVVAHGHDPDGPLGEVMSQPVFVVPPDTLGFQAAAILLERGIHHLVVHDGIGPVYGVLTEGDFVAGDTEQPLLLTGRIGRARTVKELAAARTVLPHTARLLLSSGASAVVVVHILAQATITSFADSSPGHPRPSGQPRLRIAGWPWAVTAAASPLSMLTRTTA